MINLLHMEIGIYSLYLLFVCGALYEITRAIRESWRSSIGVLLGHFLTVTVLLFIIRTLFFIVDIGLLHIDDSTLMVLWHIIFYDAILVCLFAVRALVGLSNRDAPKPSRLVAWGMGALAVSTGVALIACAAMVDPWIVLWFKGSVWERVGVLHGVAFVFAGLVAHYLFRIKTQYEKTIGSFATPLLWAIGLLSIIHVWELCTESWMIISVTEAFGESIEQLLWIPVFGTILLAFIQLHRVLVTKHRG